MNNHREHSTRLHTYTHIQSKEYLDMIAGNFDAATVRPVFRRFIRRNENNLFDSDGGNVTLASPVSRQTPNIAENPGLIENAKVFRIEKEILSDINYIDNVNFFVLSRYEIYIAFLGSLSSNLCCMVSYKMNLYSKHKQDIKNTLLRSLCIVNCNSISKKFTCTIPTNLFQQTYISQKGLNSRYRIIKLFILLLMIYNIRLCAAQENQQNVFQKTVGFSSNIMICITCLDVDKPFLNNTFKADFILGYFNGNKIIRSSSNSQKYASGNTSKLMSSNIQKGLFSDLFIVCYDHNCADYWNIRSVFGVKKLANISYDVCNDTICNRITYALAPAHTNTLINITGHDYNDFCITRRIEATVFRNLIFITRKRQLDRFAKAGNNYVKEINTFKNCKTVLSLPFQNTGIKKNLVPYPIMLFKSVKMELHKNQLLIQTFGDYKVDIKNIKVDLDYKNVNLFLGKDHHKITKNNVKTKICNSFSSQKERTDQVVLYEQPKYTPHFVIYLKEEIIVKLKYDERRQNIIDLKAKLKPKDYMPYTTLPEPIRGDFAVFCCEKIMKMNGGCLLKRIWRKISKLVIRNEDWYLKPMRISAYIYHLADYCSDHAPYLFHFFRVISDKEIVIKLAEDMQNGRCHDFDDLAIFHNSSIFLEFFRTCLDGLLPSCLASTVYYLMKNKDLYDLEDESILYFWQLLPFTISGEKRKLLKVLIKLWDDMEYAHEETYYEPGEIAELFGPAILPKKLLKKVKKIHKPMRFVDMMFHLEYDLIERKIINEYVSKVT
ncbi:hypothetical protein COBT_001642 [Conglomerata obtusa]